MQWAFFLISWKLIVNWKLDTMIVHQYFTEFITDLSASKNCTSWRKAVYIYRPRAKFGDGNVFTGSRLFTRGGGIYMHHEIGLMLRCIPDIRPGTILHPIHQTWHLALPSCYRSGTVNSNTVNSKLHLIRFFYEVSGNIFPIISCLKCTANLNFHLIRSKTLPTNDFELTVPDLYWYLVVITGEPIQTYSLSPPPSPSTGTDI